METHSFEIVLPSSTQFEKVEGIVTEKIVFPRMVAEGKDGFADVTVQTRYGTDEPGLSKFVGTYIL